MPDTLHPFMLHQEAWQAALSAVDDRGCLQATVEEVARKFLRRKNTKLFPASDAEIELKVAIKLLQESESYRRKNIGMTAPKAERRYEVLHGLAKHLTVEFPDAADSYILFACRKVERGWDW